MSKSHLFPLERTLQVRSQNRNECPDHREDLFERYQQILSYLEKEVYPNIDAGLSALSTESGFYTLHDKHHFDEVVRYAGELLGCNDKNTETFDLLTAYEIFVLLVAIRIHDAGNMYGRERHEKRAYQILIKMGDATGSDRTEKTFIADIARAHGGKTLNGNKDTIGQLKPKIPYHSLEIRAQLIAAVVRFADEICETQSRAARILLEDDALPEQSQIFHKYASRIQSVRVIPTESALLNNYAGRGCPLEVAIDFNLQIEDCYRKWNKTENGNIIKIYLIDEIISRLDKMSRERQYCAKFMREVSNVVQIKAVVSIWKEFTEDGIPDSRLIWERKFISDPEGYPSTKYFVNNEPEGKITGESLVTELKSKE